MAWHIRKKQFVLEVTVPANTTALVMLPVKSRRAVLAADGKPVGNKPVYAIGAGTSDILVTGLDPPPFLNSPVLLWRATGIRRRSPQTAVKSARPP